MTEKKHNYKLTIFLFLTGLSFFLATIDFAILNYETSKHIEEKKKESANQLKLIGKFVSEPFLKDDYLVIEQFFQKWGRENTEITYLRIYTMKQFLLTEYKRKEPATDPFFIEHQVEHDGELLLLLRMEVDLDTLREESNKVLFVLLLFLITTSVILMGVGGFALWKLLQRTAVIPLQKEIEKRSEIERSLRENEERYYKLFNESNDAIFIHNRGRILETNRQASELLGYTQNELLNKDLNDLFIDNNTVHSLENREHSVQKTDAGIHESRFKRADGSVIDVEISSSLIDGKTGLTQKIVRDISERKKTEYALERNYHIHRVVSAVLQTSMASTSLEEELQAIFELILSVPFLSLESKGCIFLVSPDKQNITMKAEKGMKPLLKEKCQTVAFGNCLCGMAAERKTIIHKPSVDDDHTTTYDGMEPHGHYCVPILEGQELLGVINLYLTDGHKKDPFEEDFLKTIADTLAGIIKRKYAETELIRYKNHLEEMVKERTEELIEAKEIAENANRTKTEFLGNMSHELKTPLHGILGFAKIGINRHDSLEKEKIRVYFKEIYDCGQRLLKLLNDLLDRSKLEAGKMTYSFSNERLSDIVSIVIKETSALSAEKGILVDFRKPDFNDVIHCDKMRMTQVIHNLLFNALKFSDPETSISISIHDEAANILLVIKDSGVGIPENDLNSIFEMFVQGSRTKTGAGGTGLGLAISRDIITAHNGTIWAENNPAGGAIFQFRIPKRKA